MTLNNASLLYKTNNISGTDGVTS